MSGDAYGMGILALRAVDDGELWMTSGRTVDLLWPNVRCWWVA